MPSERPLAESRLPGREPIFVDDEDRQALLAVIAQTMDRNPDPLEVCRYHELNPVCAGTVDAPRTLDLDVAQDAWH